MADASLGEQLIPAINKLQDIFSQASLYTMHLWPHFPGCSSHTSQAYWLTGQCRIPAGLAASGCGGQPEQRKVQRVGGPGGQGFFATWARDLHQAAASAATGTICTVATMSLLLARCMLLHAHAQAVMPPKCACAQVKQAASSGKAAEWGEFLHCPGEQAALREAVPQH